MMTTLNLTTLDPEEALLLAPATRLTLPERPEYVEVTDPESPDFVIPGRNYPVGDYPLGAVLQGGYEGARACTSGPEAGTKNLMSVFLEQHGHQGAKNLGIFNCRSVRGAATTSVHGEGRAGDHGCPNYAPWMQEWCDRLIAFSEELGIQCVIWNRRIWSSSYPDAWRPYTGLVPHIDHGHVEQTRYSARTLTVARIKQVLGIGIYLPVPPRPTPPSISRPLIQRGSKGEHVRDWQAHLARVYPAYRHDSPVKRGQVLKVDGDFGDWTVAWTRLFQQKIGIGVDGKVGPQTWRSAGFR